MRRPHGLGFAFVAAAIAAWAIGAHAYAQNLWRPVDPYRAGAVRAGMLDWPLRGNRAHDRAWMRDHLYCCSVSRTERVLYAAQTDYGPLTFVEAPGRNGGGRPQLIANGGRWDSPTDLPATTAQVSTIVEIRGDKPRATPMYLLLVIGRPGTTNVSYREAGWPTWQSVPTHDGAGWRFLSWGTGWSPNDVVIRVERRGRVTYEGTVTTLVAGGLGLLDDAPAPLVPLPADLTATAGDRGDALAFRYCLVTARSALPALLADPNADVAPGHRHLRETLRDVARTTAAVAAGPARIGALLATPESGVARAVVTACTDYDARLRR